MPHLSEGKIFCCDVVLKARCQGLAVAEQKSSHGFSVSFFLLTAIEMFTFSRHTNGGMLFT